MLRVENLNKTFAKDTPNEKTVFDGISLKVDKGDFITIIGSNGAGKSTLLNLISGKLKSDSGRVMLGGEDISNEKEHVISKKVARVFQDPSLGTSPSMTVLENMSLAMKKGKKHGFSFCVKRKNVESFKEILSMSSLGLERFMNTKVGALSGGQRQALTILMSTMVTPELLLLDEPTAALDPKTSDEIMKQIEQIIDEKKITSLMVTHDLNQAINIGNRLIMMHQGKIVLDISGDEKKRLTISKLMKRFEENQGAMFSDRSLFA